MIAALVMDDEKWPIGCIIRLIEKLKRALFDPFSCEDPCGIFGVFCGFFGAGGDPLLLALTEETRSFLA